MGGICTIQSELGSWMVNTNAASIEVSDILRTLQSYSIPNEAIGSMLREPRPEITSVQSHSQPSCDCIFSWSSAAISPADSAVCPKCRQFFACNVGKETLIVLFWLWQTFSRFCQHHCITGTHHIVPKVETALLYPSCRWHRSRSGTGAHHWVIVVEAGWRIKSMILEVTINSSHIQCGWLADSFPNPKYS